MAGAGSAIAGGSGFVGGLMTAYAQLEAADYNYASGMFNAQMQDLQARDLLKQGVAAERDVLEQGETIASAQESSYAAQGVEVDSGTPQAVQNATKAEAQIAGNNAQLEYMRAAWGKRVEAKQGRRDAKMQRKAGRYAAFGSALSAVGSLAGI
jgi:hypothetical protein